MSVSGAGRGEGYEHSLAALTAARFASRLFAKDATLWGPAAEPEARIRLGWTDFADAAERIIAEAGAHRAALAASGVDRIVLCGMGGSSLAPYVMAPGLVVLDSSHPAAVRRALSEGLDRTAVVVSSKSGGTVETLSHLAAAEVAFTEAGIDPSERIVVVTDPGSALAERAEASGMRVFLADPEVGGRFSALTAFGIVPSVLAGADVSVLVRDADAARPELAEDSEENPALVLAAALAAELPKRFVLEMHQDGTLADGLGLWAEQLIAESTGKEGKGVLPIALPHGAPGTGGDSVIEAWLSVAPREGGALSVAGTLGEQFLLWEVATAALGFLLEVDPFNQPDVEAAKVAARELLGQPAPEPTEPREPAALIASLRELAPSVDYVGVQAYIDPAAEGVSAQLAALRDALVATLGVPVAVGFGPRYLHSTGQFHKGGPGPAAFLQLVDASGGEDLAIPGAPQSFGELLAAQARGDANVLRSRGREVLVAESADPLRYLSGLIEAAR